MVGCFGAESEIRTKVCNTNAIANFLLSTRRQVVRKERTCRAHQENFYCSKNQKKKKSYFWIKYDESEISLNKKN